MLLFLIVSGSIMWDNIKKLRGTYYDSNKKEIKVEKSEIRGKSLVINNDQLTFQISNFKSLKVRPVVGTLVFLFQIVIAILMLVALIFGISQDRITPIGDAILSSSIIYLIISILAANKSVDKYYLVIKLSKMVEKKKTIKLVFNNKAEAETCRSSINFD